MTPFVVTWLILGIVTASLALYRKFVSLKEDDYLHLSPGGEPLVDKQAALAHKMDVIDKWGETLTVITVVFGIVLAGIYLYQAWLASAPA